jgi:hypothetical protein
MNAKIQRLAAAIAVAGLLGAALSWWVARGGPGPQSEAISLSEAAREGDSPGSAPGPRNGRPVLEREDAQHGALDVTEAPAGGDGKLSRELPANTPAALIAAVEMIDENGQRNPEALGGDAKPPFPVTREGIRKAMRSSAPAIRECYEAWFQAEKGLSGRLDLAFTIAPKAGGGGEIKTVTVADGGMGNIAFQGCMRSVVADLAFDSPNGETRVQYPLVFKTLD